MCWWAASRCPFTKLFVTLFNYFPVISGVAAWFLSYNLKYESFKLIHFCNIASVYYAGGRPQAAPLLKKMTLSLIIFLSLAA